MENRLLELRKNKSLYQSDIVDFLSITQSMYSRYENGINDIPNDILLRLSKFYNVNIHFLLGEDVVPNYPEASDKYKRRIY